MNAECPTHSIAVVDYAAGNPFRVQRACARAGLRADVTSEQDRLLRADTLILPGVGSFGSAMERLRALRLVDAIRRFADSGRPVVGIGLGMQLLLDESLEFGRHAGLGLVAGSVLPLPTQPETKPDTEDEAEEAVHPALKIPIVGWRSIEPQLPGDWSATLLEPLAAGEYVYFAHAHRARPSRQEDVLALAHFGSLQYCAALRSGNVTGLQFHPEWSGPAGLAVYAQLRASLDAAAGVKRDGPAQ